MNRDPVPFEAGGIARGRAALACAICMGVVGWAVWPVLSAGFVNLDDIRADRAAHRVVVDSRVDARFMLRRVTAVKSTGGVLYPADAAGAYQPLSILSLGLDSHQAGDPAKLAYRYHRTAFLLHLINTGLVFGLGLRLSRSVAWATVPALLFGLHPAQVESVGWLSQRMSVLAGFFSLLTLHCHATYARNGRLGMLIATIACYGAAVMAGPAAIPLPMVLLLMDVWPLRRWSVWSVVEKLPLLGIMVAACVAQGLVMVRGPAPLASPPNLAWHALGAIASFVERSVLPLNIAPAYRAFAASPATTLALLAFSALMVITLIAAWRGARPLALATASFLLLLLPAMIHVAYTDRMPGDSHLYLALLAPLIAVAAWLGVRRRDASMTVGHRIAWVACAAAAVGFAVESRRQASIWQSGETLFARVVETQPGWSYGHLGLVQWYLSNSESPDAVQDPDAALRSARVAANIDPDNALAQFYLGTAWLCRPGGASQAVEPLTRALALRPNWPECLQNLGIALRACGQEDKAIVYLEAARDLRPESADVRLALGQAYLATSRAASARGELQEALRDRNDPEVHVALAAAWADIDVLEHARLHLEAALAMDPQSALRAARYPSLSRLADTSGFETLIDKSGAPVLGTGIGSGAALAAQGS